MQFKKSKLSALVIGFSLFFLLGGLTASVAKDEQSEHILLQGGVFAQGGYVFGQTHPDATLKLLQTKVRVAKDGRFFAGFNRHFPKEGTLSVVYPSGETETVSFKVKPQAYQVQHIKGVKRKHVTPDPEQVKRSQREAAAIRASRSPFSEQKSVFGGFALPVKDVPQTGVYGSSRTYNGEERSWHKGLDLAAPTGTPIKAPAEGVVTAALADTFFNGNIMTIDHGFGLFSIYAHLDSMALAKGERVKEGDVIGTVGATGRATGPHLHWGVYWHNVALDPKHFLRHN